MNKRTKQKQCLRPKGLSCHVLNSQEYHIISIKFLRIIIQANHFNPYCIKKDMMLELECI